MKFKDKLTKTTKSKWLISNWLSYLVKTFELNYSKCKICIMGLFSTLNHVVCNYFFHQLIVLIYFFHQPACEMKLSTLKKGTLNRNIHVTCSAQPARRNRFPSTGVQLLIYKIRMKLFCCPHHSGQRLLEYWWSASGGIPQHPSLDTPTEESESKGEHLVGSELGILIVYQALGRANSPTVLLFFLPSRSHYFGSKQLNILTVFPPSSTFNK